MQKNLIPLIMITLIVCTLVFALRSCPTCIGHLETKSPPFFSDELYQIQQQEEENQDQSIAQELEQVE